MSFDDKDELTLVRVNDLGVIEEFTQIESPAPGVYEDMEAEIYHKIDAASASRLKKLKRSPAHMRESILNPGEQTAAMHVGTVIHTRILEPDRYAREYVIMPDFGDGRTKIAKEAKANFEIENLGKNLISLEEAIIADGIYDSLMRKPTSRGFLEAQGSIETSIFWEDAESGVRCKARIDKHVFFEDQLIVGDLKSTLNASKAAFSRDIHNYGYHMQGTIYLDGMSTVLQENHTTFLFLACEKYPPFASALYRLDKEAIELGRKEYKDLLKLYRECDDNEHWPDYGDQVDTISLPAYAFKEA
jgi:hypothetical protein